MSGFDIFAIVVVCSLSLRCMPREPCRSLMDIERFAASPHAVAGHQPHHHVFRRSAAR